MKNDLPIKNGILIPGHELEITASRAGGPGGQHVNKTSTRITLRWNIKETTALNGIQKERVLKKLESQLTSDGDLIVHYGASRSQDNNKKMALQLVAQKIRKALHVPKKRIATRIPKSIQQARLRAKTHRSKIKKTRQKKIPED